MLRPANYILLYLIIGLGSNALAQSHSEEIAQHRVAYKKAFSTDLNSPLSEADVNNLNFYNVDSNYRVIANVILLQGEKIFKMPTYAGTNADYIRFARLNFKLNGVDMQLVLYQNVALSANPTYKDYLFLPFTDPTNANTTYNGGRYLDLKFTEIENGKMMLDFNKAYNPYCAYSDGYRCPIPPAENDLTIAILAGEKRYTGVQKKRQL